MFGNGKTAVKGNWGKYLAYAANDPPYTSTNPGFTVVREVLNRGWTDTNNNKVVDCDLLNPAAQAAPGKDVCAAAVGNQANFGKLGSATIVNPAVLSGWGKRPGDTQWAATLQQEIMPRVSADVSYTRRDFHGFFVTDDLNRNVDTGYETYTLTAPSDPRLPDGGGYPITVYTPTAAANAVPSKTYLTWDTDYGPERISHWHGVDFNVNARLRGGFTGSFGTTTGRAVVDNCAIATKYNQVNANTNVAAGPDPRGCHSVDPFQTQVRGLASYVIPKIDVLVGRHDPVAAAQCSSAWRPARSRAAATRRSGWCRTLSWQQRSAICRSARRPPATTTIQIADNVNRVYADDAPDAARHALCEGAALRPDAVGHRRSI